MMRVSSRPGNLAFNPRRGGGRDRDEGSQLILTALCPLRNERKGGGQPCWSGGDAGCRVDGRLVLTTGERVTYHHEHKHSIEMLAGDCGCQQATEMLEGY
jgi:hypothetical protein